MPQNHEHNNRKKTRPASIRYRIAVAAVFLLIVSFFVYMYLGSIGKIDLTSTFGICGFKQSHGLPCPGCGWTTAAMAFSSGRILKAFYLQPASAVFCLGLLISAVIALLSALFGVRFTFLDRPFWVIFKYVIISALIIIASGWAVTLSRAMAAK